jgi:hypothetical protein
MFGRLRVFFSINADRLGVKNGVLLGIVSIRVRQSFRNLVGTDGIIGKAGLVSSYGALKVAALMCLLMCSGSSLS